MFKMYNRRLGLGPPSAKASDLICVFLRGDVLYILQEVNAGIWEFIREYYLYEIMDRLALTRVNNSLEFTICG